MQYYQRLKDLRDDKELTQHDIAKLLKTTQQQYSKYEKGNQEIPTRHIIKLADFYNTSTDYILGRTNIIEPYQLHRDKKIRQNSVISQIE